MIPDGECKGWEEMLTIATNGLGKIVVLWPSNEIAAGPFPEGKYLKAMEWIINYLEEE